MPGILSIDANRLRVLLYPLNFKAILRSGDPVIRRSLVIRSSMPTKPEMTKLARDSDQQTYNKRRREVTRTLNGLIVQPKKYPLVKQFSDQLFKVVAEPQPNDELFLKSGTHGDAAAKYDRELFYEMQSKYHLSEVIIKEFIIERLEGDALKIAFEDAGTANDGYRHLLTECYLDQSLDIALLRHDLETFGMKAGEVSGNIAVSRRKKKVQVQQKPVPIKVGEFTKRPGQSAPAGGGQQAQAAHFFKDTAQVGVGQ
ncbi:hypothetical protein HK101_000759 [Irineochytrium annulatum]|nr:hypothetical protein HK101_000759 [Irineochytrium annulatum]